MRKIRVAVTGHDLKFWNSIQQQLEKTGLFEFRVDEWENHDVHDERHTFSVLSWADVVVAEWALGNAVFASQHKLPHQKLIVRLHLQERGTEYPGNINWGNVDKLVFVGRHIMDECIEKFSIPPSICCVLGNFVDCDRYSLAKLEGSDFTFGLIGSVPSRKRMDRALDILEGLAAEDDRYMLRVKGENPAGYEWLWERPDERAYYETVYRRINSNPNLRHRVIFDPPGADVEHWLRLVGAVVSTSEFESFHMAVAEAAASGALPVVWDWEGARDIYPELNLVDSIAAAVEEVRSVAQGGSSKRIEAVKDGVRARYGLENVVQNWKNLLQEPSTSTVSMGSNAMRTWLTAPRVDRRTSGDHVKNLEDMKVALLCDEFTYNSFKDEFKAVVVEPNDWREVFAREKPDLFFCESAWSGVDSVRRPWKGRVYTSTNFKSENRKELLEILDYCRESGIPTVFWNKEDPSHYDDQIHNFVDTAVRFDVVFTTDEDCVDRYKRDHGHKRVGCLPFATNPRIFNPGEQTEAKRSNDVVFAGSWYAYHQERVEVMRQIFDAIVASGRGLEIYDRFYGGDDPNHQFPDEYVAYTRAAVAHSEIDAVYKSSIFGLNINTETRSPTMFARRVYELISCNTLCVSNYSVGIERIFGDAVVFLDRDPAALARLTSEEIDEKRARGLHQVLREHTYKERFKTILSAADVPFHDRSGELTIVVVVDSFEAAEVAIEFFDGQASSLVNPSLLLVVADTVGDIDVPKYYEAYNRFGISVVSWGSVEKYVERPTAIIKTNYFALMEPSPNVSPGFVADAFLHASYAGSAIISTGQDQKYQYSSSGVVTNVIADSRWLMQLMRCRGQLFNATFYSV
ncbi:glycosyltransferase [uncultured Stenotrophomonas sp.]|uniref:glycosyltransferase family protein n=1 Tax=uncultured Stenotrophomonas sp. TaxID=165438 RepID=UPI0025EC54D9|nr:glycosyltransferase [uncultured Stenotrophomonas sp.]